jgi:hypothetical protein
VCLWPRGAAGDGTQGDWELQRELWLQSCPSSARVDFSASNSVPRAARYVSKYVSKGVQTSAFSPELRARVLAGTYNTRWLFSSSGAWVRFRPCCKSCGVPVTVRTVRFSAPGTWPIPDSTPEWIYERGPPQYSFELSGP